MLLEQPCEGSLRVCWNSSNFHLGINNLLEKSAVRFYLKNTTPCLVCFLFFSWNFSLCNVCSTRVGYFLVSWVSLHACVEKPSPGMLSPNLPPWKLFCLPLKYLELPCLSWQSLAICDYLNISKIKRQLFHHTNYVSRAH